MARAKSPFNEFNEGIAITGSLNGKHNPKTSWWMTPTSREAFYQMAQREQPRMMSSRYGQMRSPTFGPTDPKAGLLRARYEKAPGMATEE